MKYFFIFSIANTIQKILNNKREKERICKYTRLIIKHELDEFGGYEELFFVTESAAIDEFRRRLNNQRYEEEVWHQGDLNILILNLEDEDVDKAVEYLKISKRKADIRKWNTKKWGESKADFGRK